MNLLNEMYEPKSEQKLEPMTSPALALLTWREIREAYNEKYGENHHCLTLHCTKCENTMTCRCSHPKIEEYGICDECCKPKTEECPTCHGKNAYIREEHPDTDMNEMVLYCPDCKKSHSRGA